MKLITPHQIFRILSIILLIETVAFLLCIPVAYFYEEALSPFFLSGLITYIFSTILSLLSGKSKTEKFSNRDGYLVVTIAWILFLTFGTLPYLISGSTASFTDALFESCSGFTTTGSSIFPDVESLPYSILFWRSFTHWIGGLGIIALVIIILPSLGITGYQLFTLESSLKEKIHPRTQAVGLRLLFIYVGLTLTETILLYLGEMTLFESICHSFGTVATGGFSVKNNGMMYYSAYSQYIIMIFMFLSGISMVVYYYIVKFNFNKVKKNEELLFYIVATVIAGVLVTSIIFTESGMTPEAAFREGFFNVISISSSTGFANADYITWSSPAVMIIFLLLFTGACTGSTSGNIKIARHVIVFKAIKAAFIKLLHPNAIPNVRFNGKLVPEKASVSIMSFIIMYLFIFLTGTIIVVITGPDVISAASSVAASLGNIGPGLGTVGPMSNYSHFPGITKITLCIIMIMGRIEIIAVMSLFTRSFWKL
jgi:trk system potassium uptake protein TrkH